MRVQFNTDKSLVVFHHETASEYKALHKFPAFTREGIHFCAPSKPHVVYNIISRLQRARKRVVVDADVWEFANKKLKLKEIPESFKYYTPPKRHQDIALRYLYTLGSAGLLLDPGMGKSKVVLDYIVLMGFKKTLIVAPKPLMFVWEDEIRVHRPELSCYCVSSTSFDAELDGIQSANVTIINYDKAVLMSYELRRIGYEFMHIDEFLIKNPSTERTKTLTSLSRSIPYKCGGSGTLVNNTILDVYCPVRYLEPALVGGNYTNFKEMHTVPNPNDKRQVVNYKNADLARSVLDSCCIVMSKSEWLDLPGKSFIDIQVSLSTEQRDVYWDLTKNYAARIGESVVTIDNPLVMMSKLYQVSNGFLYLNEASEDEFDLLGEEYTKKRKSKRSTYLFENNAKADALKSLLDEKLSNRKAIIWFNMEAEFDIIRKVIEALGHQYLSIRGGDKKIGSKVREFNSTAGIRWLVCQAKSVNYGVTVLGTEKSDEVDYEIAGNIDPSVYTEVFYSLNFSLEVYLQQQDRIHRLGQTRGCEYYRILTSTPIDNRIRDSLDEKMYVRQDMLRDIATELQLPESTTA